jgi:CO/xanthine dehydrogenase FAD-binding subunit
MEYFAPRNISETLVLLGRWKHRGKLIAGGTNVIPDMRAKALKYSALIDISHLRNLSYVKDKKKRIRIGSLTTISKLASSKIIQDYAPILSEPANQLGNRLVRNRATIAGNLADASPATDTAVPLLVFEAIVITDKRQIPIDRFFLGPNQTLQRG